jgi:hypothetical protein
VAKYVKEKVLENTNHNVQKKSGTHISRVVS